MMKRLQGGGKGFRVNVIFHFNRFIWFPLSDRPLDNSLPEKADSPWALGQPGPPRGGLPGHRKPGAGGNGGKAPAGTAGLQHNLG